MTLRISSRAVRTLAFAAAVAALAACAQNPTLTRRELINETEYAPYRGKGAGAIRGQVVIVLSNGQRSYGAGGNVWLLPVTTQTATWMRKVVLPGEVKPPVFGPEAVQWTALSDAEGRFEFTGLPAGTYYVTCPVGWVENGDPRKAIAFGQVTIGPGQSAEVEVGRGMAR